MAKSDARDEALTCTFPVTRDHGRYIRLYSRGCASPCESDIVANALGKVADFAPNRFGTGSTDEPAVAEVSGAVRGAADVAHGAAGLEL